MQEFTLQHWAIEPIEMQSMQNWILLLLMNRAKEPIKEQPIQLPLTETMHAREII